MNIDNYVTAYCQACHTSRRVLASDKAPACPSCQAPLLGKQPDAPLTDIQQALQTQQDAERNPF